MEYLLPDILEDAHEVMMTSVKMTRNKLFKKEKIRLFEVYISVVKRVEIRKGEIYEFLSKCGKIN